MGRGEKALGHQSPLSLPGLRFAVHKSFMFASCNSTAHSFFFLLPSSSSSSAFLLLLLLLLPLLLLLLFLLLLLELCFSMSSPPIWEQGISLAQAVLLAGIS